MNGAMTLSQLQRWLAEQFVRPRALSKYSEVVAAAERHIQRSASLTAVERVEIYRQQFWLRHTASLLEDFPGVAGILGQAQWERLAESYLTEHPCRSFTLRNLGANFAQHIAAQSSLPERALCSDMARLEWCYVEIFDAADVPPLDGNKLAALSEDAWQHAQIVLSPALRLLQVSYPVVALRQALVQASQQDGNDAPVPIPDPEAHHLLLCRDAHRALHQESLPLPAWTLLERLQRGQALGAACETLAAQQPENATLLANELGGWFAHWTRLNVVVDVRA